MKERTILPRQRILINNCRRNEGNKKSLLEHTVITVAGMIHQCMLKIDEGLGKKRIYAQYQSISFQITKEENNFTEEKPDGHPQNQVIKVNITSDKTCSNALRTVHHFETFVPQMHNFNLIRTKTSDKPTLRDMPQNA